MLGTENKSGLREELAIIQASFMQGISRSSKVIIGAQIRLYLARYFSGGGLLLVVVSVHIVLCVMSAGISGFNASWDVFRGLIQSVVIQLVVSEVSDDDWGREGILNLLVLLMFAESLPVLTGWVGYDVSTLTTAISFSFSDKVEMILQGSGIPVVGAVLGFAFRGRGLFGQTMALTGVNCACSALFGAISGGELSFAWPVLLLYFVYEVAGQYEQVKPFVDYGLYKASHSIFSGVSLQGLESHVIAICFTFLALALPGDPVWTGLCVLVLVQASSDWFLSGVHGVSQSDPVLAGLCIVTAVHFVCVGVQMLGGK